jgi:hypothetical protein
MKKLLLLTAIASVASVAAVAPVMAQTTAAGAIGVGALTTKLCTTPNSSAVALGTYTGVTAIGPIATTATFKCTKTTPVVSVEFKSLSTGSTTGGNLVNLLNPGSPIAYTFTAPTVPGPGAGLSGGAASLTTTSNVSVAAGQDPVPGAAADVIQVRVTY